MYITSRVDAEARSICYPISFPLYGGWPSSKVDDIKMRRGSSMHHAIRVAVAAYRFSGFQGARGS